MLLGLTVETVWDLARHFWLHSTMMHSTDGNSLASILTNASHFPLWMLVDDSISFFLWFVWCWLFFKLFGLYEKQLIFTSQNVRYIKYLGLVTVVRWSLAFIENLRGFWQFMSDPLNPFKGDWLLIITPQGLSGLIWGVALILIAWIMDEGRKIQEEQELTV